MGFDFIPGSELPSIYLNFNIAGPVIVGNHANQVKQLFARFLEDSIFSDNTNHPFEDIIFFFFVKKIKRLGDDRLVEVEEGRSG